MTKWRFLLVYRDSDGPETNRLELELGSGFPGGTERNDAPALPAEVAGPADGSLAPIDRASVAPAPRTAIAGIWFPAAVLLSTAAASFALLVAR